MARAPRVYSSRKYSHNPLFRARRRREVFARLRGYSWRGKLVAGSILAILATIVWAFLYNPYFTVNEVVIKGAGYVDEGRLYDAVNEQLDERRWLILRQDNIFALSKRQLLARIAAEVMVHDLQLNKDLPGSVTISFVEAEPVAVWSENGNHYYIDADLRVLAPVSEGVATNAPYLHLNAAAAETHVVWTNGVRVVDVVPVYLAAAQAVRERYGRREAQAEGEKGRGIATAFTITAQETTLTMQYDGGPAVYFNVDGDIDAQIAKLDVLLAEKFNPDELATLRYIDLRFGEKIYYQ